MNKYTICNVNSVSETLPSKQLKKTVIKMYIKFLHILACFWNHEILFVQVKRYIRDTRYKFA